MTDQTRACWIHLVDGDIVSGGGMAIGAAAAAIVLAQPGRVQVDDAVLEQLRAGGTWRWTGIALEPAAPPVDMTRERNAALWWADQAAEAARRSFLSAGAGQAMEYLLTLDEAREYCRTPSPQPADFPLLAAEQVALQAAGQTATLTTIAASVLAADKTTRVQMAAIKAQRRVRKMMIRAAETPRGVAEAISQPPLSGA